MPEKLKRKYVQMPVLYWKTLDKEAKRLTEKGKKKVTAAEVLRRYAKSLEVKNEPKTN